MEKQKITSGPDVEQALDDWSRINNEGKRWARCEFQFEPTRRIEVEVGPIHSNGMKERATSTYVYSHDAFGRVFVHVQGHPC